MDIFERMEVGLGGGYFTKLEIKRDFPTNYMPEAQWIVDEIKKLGHEKLILIRRPEVKLKTAIAIHDRTLGKEASGGIRMLAYPDAEAMIKDALRLSRAMTYKAALADVSRGGAKCVVWGDPRVDKTMALLGKLAEEIELLKGEYIGGEDMNIDENDIRIMRATTSFVSGLPETWKYGRYRGSGDPSPVTARGIVYGMKACLKFLHLGSLEGKTVAIQGLGKVGHRLARFLYQEGASQIIGTDTDPHRIAHFQEEFQSNALPGFRESAKVVGVDEIYAQECDIFAPCAAGGSINKTTVPLLKCKVVAGAANNQLQEDADGKALRKRDILYAPDYVINAGGLMNIDDERHPEGYNELRVQQKLETIFNNLLKIFWYSERLKMPTNLVADMLVEEKIGVTKLLS